MKKATNLPHYKTSQGNRYFTEPKILYFGGGLHYVNKQGRFTHAKPSEMVADLKSKTTYDFIS